MYCTECKTHFELGDWCACPESQPKTDDSVLTASDLDDLISGVSPKNKSINELGKIQDYRFGSMLKGEHYAFARGLTINPTHLPQALDAMRADGWHLIAIFGQTNASDIGFVFEREESSASDPEWDASKIDVLTLALANAQADVLRLQRQVGDKPPSFDGAVDILVSGLGKAQTEVLRLTHRVDELLRANTALVEANRKTRAERDQWMERYHGGRTTDPI